MICNDTGASRNATVALMRTARARVPGIDVTRGLAVVGMVAMHVFPSITAGGEPTTASLIAAGRSATTFALVAGLSLALLTGGATPPRDRARRTRAAVGIATRGVLLGLLGFLLAYLDVVDVILSSYGLLFLLVIPLLWARPIWLMTLTVVLSVVGPVWLLWVAALDLPYAGAPIDPTLTTLVEEPGGVLVLLLFTGEYPAVTYLAYLCAGLAIGRLDLTSRRLAWWLAGSGVVVAAAAEGVSWFLLHPLGGLSRLLAETSGGSGDAASAAALLWEPAQTDSWWYLALASPHAHTTFDMARTLGSALALLGAMLLVTRSNAVMRLLGPVAAVGSMPLTVYSTHVVLLAVWTPDTGAGAYFVVLIGVLTLSAVLWRRRFGQGPLERALAAASRKVSR